MSDATLPDIRSSSEAPASANGSGKSPSHGDSDTSLIQPERLNATEDTSGDGDGKADSKQRRKRTRYVAWNHNITWLSPRFFRWP
jgi:hypothetical protein